MTKHFNCVAARTLTGILLGLISIGSIVRAQDGKAPEVRSSDNSSNASDSNATTDPASSAGPSAEASPSRVESSLFSSLFMAGKTRDQFKPLTRKERLTARV